MKTPSELAPEEDQGAFLGLVNVPQYATAEYTQRFAAGFTRAGEKIPEVDDTFLIVGIDGGGSGFVGFKLKEWSERTQEGGETKQEIQTMLERQCRAFRPSSSRRPRCRARAADCRSSMSCARSAIPAQAYEVAEQVRKKALASGKFIVVQNSMSFETPRARIVVDRDRAAALGVQVSEIGTTLGALVGGAPISKFDRDNRSYDVISQVAQENRLNPGAARSVLCARRERRHGAALGPGAHRDGRRARGDRAVQPAQRRDHFRAAAADRDDERRADATLRSIAAEVMPAGFYEDFAGQSRLEVQEGNSIALAFGLAVIVIYLVLAAQFESFRDPFIIMMSVPLSMFGAMIFLNLGLATLNIYTQVGLITLVGLITKHGILMVEFANELKDEARPHAMRGDPGGGARAPAADPHDDGRHGARRRAAHLRERRGRRGALLHGPRHRRRHVDRYDLHALRRADVLHIHRKGGRAPATVRRKSGRPVARRAGRRIGRKKAKRRSRRSSGQRGR